jgi:hypothetical protein
MLKLKGKALRLLNQYVRFGGIAGPVVFLSQGECVRALWCAVTAGFCIVIMALAILLADWLTS